MSERGGDVGDVPHPGTSNAAPPDAGRCGEWNPWTRCRLAAGHTSQHSFSEMPGNVGTNGIHLPTIRWVANWLRDSHEAELVRTEAIDSNVPPEDALAHTIEKKWGL